MQESRGPEGVLSQEFFLGRGKHALEAQREVIAKMDARQAELASAGHTQFRRVKIGRNASCPCGSGLKFKKCCIDKAA